MERFEVAIPESVPLFLKEKDGVEGLTLQWNGALNGVPRCYYSCILGYIRHRKLNMSKICLSSFTAYMVGTALG